jgi:hypothetical protein
MDCANVSHVLLNSFLVITFLSYIPYYINFTQSCQFHSIFMRMCQHICLSNHFWSIIVRRGHKKNTHGWQDYPLNKLYVPCLPLYSLQALCATYQQAQSACNWPRLLRGYHYQFSCSLDVCVAWEETGTYFEWRNVRS